MIILPVTLATAAAAAILNIWLMIRVGRARAEEKIFVGHEDNEFVVRRMRAHANFVENAPFVLILVGLIELSGRGDPWLAYVAGLFIIGRVAHGFGMDGGPLGKGRMIGTIISMLTLLGLGIYAAMIAGGVL